MFSPRHVRFKFVLRFHDLISVTKTMEPALPWAGTYFCLCKASFGYAREIFADFMLRSFPSGNVFTGMDASGHISEETKNARYI